VHPKKAAHQQPTAATRGNSRNYSYKNPQRIALRLAKERLHRNRLRRTFAPRHAAARQLTCLRIGLPDKEAHGRAAVRSPCMFTLRSTWNMHRRTSSIDLFAALCYAVASVDAGSLLGWHKAARRQCRRQSRTRRRQHGALKLLLHCSALALVAHAKGWHQV
jgi:hypothetical protein